MFRNTQIALLYSALLLLLQLLFAKDKSRLSPSLLATKADLLLSSLELLRIEM